MSTWTTQETLQALLGLVSVIGLAWVGRLCFLAVFVEVSEESMTLVTRFGKLVKVLKTPGAVFLPERSLPWVSIIEVSLQRDFRHYRDININDKRGTSVIIELWVEFRIADPAKALFGIEDWEESLQGLVIHSATSTLSSREFSSLMGERPELGRLIKERVTAETTRWGLEVYNVYIRKVGLRPDVLRQMFEAVGAKLETAKAEVEEEGRIRIGMLEAQTATQVAALVADAKSQHLAAIGRAYEKMGKDSAVLKAYAELHELSIAQADRLISFQGFSDSEMKPLEAAMVNDVTNAKFPPPRPVPRSRPIEST